MLNPASEAAVQVRGVSHLFQIADQFQVKQSSFAIITLQNRELDFVNRNSYKLFLSPVFPTESLRIYSSLGSQYAVEMIVLVLH